MKKRLLTLFLTLVLATTSLGLFACGGDKGGSEDGPFYVRYYPGGYGEEWIKEYVKEFLASEGLSDKEIKIVADDDIGNATNMLNSTKECPDVIISNGISQEDISNGLIAPLDSVYSTSVKMLDGSSKTIADFMDPIAKKMNSRSLEVGSNEINYWAIPLTSVVISIAYNETLLYSVPHLDSNGTVNGISNNTNWNRVPENVGELITCFADVVSAGKTPLAWSAKDGGIWFESLIHTWLAQGNGIDAFYKIWEFENGAEAWNNNGLVTAFEQIEKLIINKEKGEYKNSYGNPSNLTIKTAQEAFAKGEVVFCMTGDFFANEFSSLLAQNSSTVNAKLMRVPALDGHENEKYTYVNTNGVMYVGSKSKNKDLAKKFLAFICDEKHVVDFTERTGGIRPFQTNVFEKSTKSDWSNFNKSTFNLYYGESGETIKQLISYPKNEDQANVIYTYAGVRVLYQDTDAFCTPVQYLLTKSAHDVVIGSSATDNTSLYYKAREAFRGYNDIYGEFMN